jgi:hypothetical protein
MPEKKDDSGCALILSFGLITFTIYLLGTFLFSIWKFFSAPDWLQRSLEMIEAVGMCCGAAILFIVGLSIWFNLFPPKEGPIDDEPY